MRIDAISSYNYAQNSGKNLKSKNVNFGEIVFNESTLNTMYANLNLSEIDAMTAAAEDVIDLREMLDLNNISNPFKRDYTEEVLLKGAPENSKIRLLYEPYVDERYDISNPPDPFGGGRQEIRNLGHYELGGRFQILNTYVPSIPDYKATFFDLPLEGYSPLKVVFDEKNASKFRVYTANDGDKEQAMIHLSQHDFMPNEKCPVPTKNFVRRLVRNVYEFLISQNIIDMSDKEKAKLAENLKFLRKQYGRQKLEKFLYCV